MEEGVISYMQAEIEKAIQKKDKEKYKSLAVGYNILVNFEAYNVNYLN